MLGLGVREASPRSLRLALGAGGEGACGHQAWGSVRTQALRQEHGLWGWRRVKKLRGVRNRVCAARAAGRAGPEGCLLLAVNE